MKKNIENKPHVLLVDDDTRVIELAAQGRHELDALNITTCTSGASARAALSRTCFDLILCDLNLPDADGISLLRLARETSPNIAIVLMTARAASEVDSIAAHMSVNRVLVKPFGPEELIGVVRSVFPGRVPAATREKPPVYKVILGGDGNVGKTSLITRFSTGAYDPTREMTIGIDFHVGDMTVGHGRARLVVWDLGGQERFAPARQTFYRGTRAVGLVFDASNRDSFDNLMHWRREVHENLDRVPVLLLANKVDLRRQVSRREAEALAADWKTQLFEASCASGEGVAEFFEALAHSAHEYTRRTRATQH